MSFLTNISTGIIVMLAMVAIFTASVLLPMNEVYNKSFSTGMNTSAIDSFQSAKVGADAQLGTGSVETTAQGLTLTSSWSAIKVIYSSITSFISGQFIYNLMVNILGLPEILAIVAVLSLWFLLIFAIIKLFMKVQA